MKKPFTAAACLCVAGLCSSQHGYAQFAGSGAQYRINREDIRREAIAREKSELPLNPPGDEAQQSPLAGEPVQIEHYAVFGNTVLAESEISALLQSFSGRLVYPPELHDAALALRKGYREQGYFAAQVYVPPQAIEDGLVTLHVYEGELEAHGVELNSTGERVRNDRIIAVLSENVATGTPLHSDPVERAILLVDDIPGVTSHSVIYPGAEPGTARFLMSTDDTPAVTGNADVDNLGSYYTGEYRAAATVYFNSPTGSGDQLTLRGVTSGPDYHYLFADYSMPVGGNGLRLGASVDWMEFELGEDLRPQNRTGEAASLRIHGNYPIIRRRFSNLFATVEYDYIDLEDDADGEIVTDRRVQLLTFRLEGDHDDHDWADGKTYFGAGLNAGKLDIRGSEAFIDFDRNNLDSDGTFYKIDAHLGRLQHLSGPWSAYAHVYGQWADRNLDSSQKYYFGGPFSIPGYPLGELGADTAVQFHLDLRRDFYSLPWKGTMQASVFYEGGWGRIYNDPWEGWEQGNNLIRNEFDIHSLGFTASQHWNSLLLRATIGWQIGDSDSKDPITGENIDGSDSNYRGWFQAVYYF